jgi:hypothetical protein
MAIFNQAQRYGQIQLARRVGRSIPWLGAVLAVGAIGVAIRRKGFVGGTVDTALNAMPFVGGLKNAVEAVRGRDFIRDREIRRSVSPRWPEAGKASR